MAHFHLVHVRFMRLLLLFFLNRKYLRLAVQLHCSYYSVSDTVMKICSFTTLTVAFLFVEGMVFQKDSSVGRRYGL